MAIESAFRVEAISLNDEVYIVNGNEDPSTGIGITAPVGTLYLRLTGELYQKIGLADTDWTLVGSSSASLSTLLDTNLIEPIPDNSQLRYDAATSKWINVPAPPAPPTNSYSLVQLLWGPITAISGTTSIPKDTLAPNITEGTEIWSQAITTVSNSSTIRISTGVTTSSSNASLELVFAVFRDNVCIGTAVNATSNKGSGFAVTFSIYDIPPAMGTYTYSCRVGRTGNGVWSINDIDGSPGLFAGTLQQNSYSVEEIGEVA